MQPGVKWFQGPSGAAFKFQCGPRGIHIPGLAAEVQLKERPLKLNGVVVDFDEHGYVSLTEAEEFIGQRGASEDNSIQVTGQPAGTTRAAARAPEHDNEVDALRAAIAHLTLISEQERAQARAERAQARAEKEAMEAEFKEQIGNLHIRLEAELKRRRSESSLEAQHGSSDPPSEDL